MVKKTTIPVILGPTASGKTELAVKIGPQLNAEIISADSRQIYKDLDIGTAKPTSEQRQIVRFHMIDFLPITESYSAGQFAEDALPIIKDILNRKKLPLVVGGSGLYIRALFTPMFKSPRPDPELRARLDGLEQKYGIDHLYNELLRIDPAWAKKVGPRDRQRIKRGLEIYQLTGRKISDWIKEKVAAPYQPYYIGIELPRKVLYQRINERFLRMIDQGLIGEVERLLRQGLSKKLNAFNTFGYKEIIAYLENRLSLPAAIHLAQKNTRNYARRQLTWFRKIKDVHWFPPAEDKIIQAIKNVVSIPI
ncbi:MAG: tRNA (adenosine(37)-N6)-dimethylallyltransferase MiaA [candidate division WOR-3 bacterium]